MEPMFITLFRGQQIIPPDGDHQVRSISFGPFSHIEWDAIENRLLLHHNHNGDVDRLFIVAGRIYYGGILYSGWLTFCGSPDTVDPFDADKSRPQRRRQDQPHQQPRREHHHHATH